MTVQLAAHDLAKSFGGLTALAGVSFEAEEGELIGLIGPNGSGKTTLLNLLSGFYEPDHGSAWFDGERIDGREPSRLATKGIARTFQVTKVFRRISVLENLLVPGLVDWRASRAEATDRARKILGELHLDGLAEAMASELSGGQGKLLEFGRLMMLSPKVVLLDEPFGGVHPELKTRMHEVIRKWHSTGVTVILISHDMGSVFGLCRRVIGLAGGRVIADGTPEAVRRDPAVLEAYLGGDTATRAV